MYKCKSCNYTNKKWRTHCKYCGEPIKAKSGDVVITFKADADLIHQLNDFCRSKSTKDRKVMRSEIIRSSILAFLKVNA